MDAYPKAPTVESDVDLRSYNSFGLPARARRMVRSRSGDDLRGELDRPAWG